MFSSKSDGYVTSICFTRDTVLYVGFLVKVLNHLVLLTLLLIYVRRIHSRCSSSSDASSRSRIAIASGLSPRYSLTAAILGDTRPSFSPQNRRLAQVARDGF